MSSQDKKTYLDVIVEDLGYPSWVPNALIRFFLGATIAAAALGGVSDGSILTFNGGYTFDDILNWTPVVSFAIACMLCGLHRAHSTLVNSAFVLMFFGLTQGPYMMDAELRFWAWGVVLAIACLLLPAFAKIVWWLLALVYLDRPARIIGRFFSRWGGRQIDRANARVSSAQSS